MKQLDALLRDGLLAIQCPLENSVQEHLLAYLQLLVKWNKTYNLSGIRDAEAMVPQLLLDALVAIPFIERGPVIDVGSGAGLPGIPLAIARPDLAFTLIDSNGKKTRFIKHVVTTLQLSNVVVVQSRVESFRPEQPARWVISRAFSELAKFCQLTRHLLDAEGHWLAWKGTHPEQEIAGVNDIAVLVRQVPVKLPGVSVMRYLLELAPKV